MSTDLVADRCSAQPAKSVIEPIPARAAKLGSLDIRRALPRSARRMVGPWCFLDRYGPVAFSEGAPMDLAPHPHIGLQTVSWLVEGELLHRDSLGNESLLRSGGINLMTAGAGIAHSEETPARNSGRLSGAQLWIALPDASRNVAPSFEYRPHVVDELRGGRVSLMIGRAGQSVSPATTYSPIVGADVEVFRGASLSIPLRSDFEHALLVVDGSAVLESTPLVPDVLYYLGTGRQEITLASREGARMLLIGGTPFSETVLMWWNFVARTPEEIAAAAGEWNEHRRFGVVPGNVPPIPAPPLKGRVRPPAAS